MENLVTQLKEDAILKGLCFPWQAKFKDKLSIPALVRMYIKGIDFCISEDYPTLDFLRDKFKGKCEPYGVFIDDVVQWHNAPDVVLNGSCKAELEYDNYSVSRLFIRHTSIAEVKVSGHALVTIDVFDDTVLNIHAKDSAKVIISQYGNSEVNVQKENTARVIVNLMHKKTY